MADASAGGEQAAQPPVVASAPAAKPVEGAYNRISKMICLVVQLFIQCATATSLHAFLFQRRVHERWKRYVVPSPIITAPPSTRLVCCAVVIMFKAVGGASALKVRPRPPKPHRASFYLSLCMNANCCTCVLYPRAYRWCRTFSGEQVQAASQGLVPVHRGLPSQAAAMQAYRPSGALLSLSSSKPS